MPLRDHFHPPLLTGRHWQSFHAAWAAQIVATLNRKVLPARCFAEAQVHVGSRVEVDVATFEREEPAAFGGVGSNGGVAVEAWAPPATALVMPAVFPDEIEVQVFESSAGPTLVGAVELVSPGNKDRPETRRSFVAKCAGYLQQGVGPVVVDVVTDRHANLHDDLVRFLDQPPAFEMAGSPPLYVVAYRPGRRQSGDQIELWPTPLAVGRPLPVAPLALRGVATVPVDLEATYAAACEDSRL